MSKTIDVSLLAFMSRRNSERRAIRLPGGGVEHPGNQRTSANVRAANAERRGVNRDGSAKTKSSMTCRDERPGSVSLLLISIFILITKSAVPRLTMEPVQIRPYMKLLLSVCVLFSFPVIN